jgi:hypothetical protein
VAGWRYSPQAPEESAAVIEGQVVAVKDIDAVFTRLPCVFDYDLVQIVRADRAYVATEMTAFLTSWLDELTCLVLNRPTPACLAGPNWRVEQWVYTAARIGIPVQSVRRYRTSAADNAPDGRGSPPVSVTVIGERCFGAVVPSLAQQARRLASAANVDLLGVHFSGPDEGALFVGADLFPDVNDDTLASAILEYLLAANNHRQGSFTAG